MHPEDSEARKGEIPVLPVETRRARRSLKDTSTGQSLFIGLWILGTLATLAALAGAFTLGTYIANQHNPEPVETEVESEPGPSFPDLSLNSRSPGIWAFDELRGGECITGYTGPFEDTYQVVPCSSPHDAEVVKASLLSIDPTERFPGEDAVLETAQRVCEVSRLLNLAVASKYSDLLMDYSYPVTEKEWDSGQRVVYCFVYRPTGASLSGSLVN